MTELEKFLVERIIQRSDYSETISNKHRSINGYVQLKELIILCELSLERNQTVRTLKLIIEESQSNRISQNIKNDLIISQYFQDLRDYVTTKLDPNKLTTSNEVGDINEIEKLKHRLKIFEKQLDNSYFDLLIREFLDIDYSSSQIDREAKKITQLVDILMPFLSFKGYSISSINAILKGWYTNKQRITAGRILSRFSFKKREYYFLINVGKKNTETQAFCNLLEKKIGSDSIVVTGKIVNASNITERLIDDDDTIVVYKASTLDPQMQIRQSYDSLLKLMVITKDRMSLDGFNNFFNRSFWASIGSDGKKIGKYHPTQLGADPIDINSRTSTLALTLSRSQIEYGYSYKIESDLPISTDNKVQNAMYYYNLALGSKSIENSLSLLWTSLETVLPYRTSRTDIQSIQEFVSKILAIGSFSRDVCSFAVRFIQSNQQNWYKLKSLGTKGYEQYTSKGLTDWFIWLEKSDSNVIDNRIKKMKGCSELLTYQYCEIGKIVSNGKCSDLFERLERSSHSIKFQLQRMYLHRNRIVHSGALVNEYMNLWLHLEWYIGKILAYALIKIDLTSEEKERNLIDVFQEVEADYEYLKSYLSRNSSERIEKATRIKKLLFKHVWQSH